MKKWTKRLSIGLFVFGTIAAIAGATFEQVARRRIASSFPPSGRLVEVDGRRSHIDCRGAGTPIVVLEAGFDAGGSFTWDPVHDELASLSRTCAYDRAGILWSDRRTEPRNAHLIADELHALLTAANEAPPYIMVGHSLGGPLMRVFDARHGDEVSGFIFVDSSHPEQRERFPSEVSQQRRPERISVTTRVLLTLGFARLTGGGDRLAGGVERDMRSAHMLRTMPGVIAELNGIGTIFDQAVETGALGDRPVIVLTAGNRPGNPAMSDEVNARLSDTWSILQTELAELSPNSEHRVISGATHYMQRDAPDVVVAAVSDVLRAVRTGRPLRSPEGG